MTNKPLSFYDITDALGKLGAWHGDPIEHLQYVDSYVRVIDMNQFTKEELRWIAEDQIQTGE